MYGGKADSLLNLKSKGYRVPDFFVVSIDDYKQFLEENNLLEIIKKLLKENKRDEIKLIIKESKINDKLKNQIGEKFEKLNSEFVSVRSSALNEDGKSKAFAGQYDSYLNVTKDNLIEKIKLCWISFYNSNVNEYYQSDKVLGMNVIIQKMIDADYAGVAFSVDPTSDTGNYSIIELVKGLGENLVSGKVTPIKFIVRRDTNHIDLKIGNIGVRNELIEQLEKLVLEIEKEYGCPMDIEYAIKDKKIYILQARPITTKNLGIKSFSLAITRPQSIIEMEISYKGEYEGIKNITRDLYYFKPLFLYNPKFDNVEIYYNEVDLEEDPRLMYYYMDLDFDKLKKYYDNTIKNDISYIQNFMIKKIVIDFKELLERMIRIYPFISLGQLAGHYEKITPRLKEFLINFRNNYDAVIHDACDAMIDVIRQQLPREYQPYINFITLEECLNKLPDIDILELRKKGFVYFGKLHTIQNYEKWLKENNISIKMIEEASLAGNVAFSKSVIGKVCIIHSEKDFEKFEKDDILVTPMTVPKFMRVIKMASGIITDEGGITCHASIIARELKIPCIVGCRNASKLLKDGDLVKMDGATGNIIKISNER